MSEPKDLSKVCPAEFKQFLDSFDTVLSDCDGVLFLLWTAIEGTAEVLTKLKSLGKRVRYVTNNCIKTRRKFVEFMREAGFTLREDEVIMPTIAIVDYLKSIKFEKKLFVLSSDGLKQDLMDAGFKLADTGPSVVNEDTKSLIAALCDNDEDVGAVIVDIDLNLNFLKLQKVVFYLQNLEIHFITGAQDSLMTVGKTIHLIGPQHFQNAIKAVSGREPMSFGKPSQHLINFVNNRFNVDPNRTLFIGDTFLDMAFANRAGYQKLLVFTGIANKEDLKDCKDPKLLPDYYLNSLGDMSSLLDRMSNGFRSSL